MKTILQEKALLLALLTMLVGYPLEHWLLELGLVGIAIGFIVVFGVIMTATMRVAHQAEVLAQRLGEPYGTLILTGSAVAVEVLMLLILMMSSNNPTLVRDTIYAALMLDINGIMGIAAIIGGIKHGEQPYNVDSSNSYIAMILVAVAVGMVLPDFIPEHNWRIYSVFNIIIMLIMYGVFTRMQLVSHRSFFEYPYKSRAERRAAPEHYETSTALHSGLLVVYLVAIGVLAELLSVFLAAGVDSTGLPLGLVAVAIALISASPEILTAMRAAARNRMQTVVNIALGASLATVLMTIPVIEVVALWTGAEIVMGLTPLQGLMVLLTMMVAMINLHDGETNALEGMVHLVLFATFVVSLFLG